MTFLDIDIEPQILYWRVEEILDPSEAQLLKCCTVSRRNAHLFWMSLV